MILEIAYTFFLQATVIDSSCSKICVFEIVDALDGKKNKVEE